MNIIGIGVDTALISEIARIIENDGPDGPFIRRTFTAAEKEGAAARTDKAAYFAARFAAKEAVFKAINHQLGEQSFDFRIVETLHRDDGSPYINTGGKLSEVLARADVDRLHLSITTEGDMATAFVVAQSD